MPSFAQLDAAFILEEDGTLRNRKRLGPNALQGAKAGTRGTGGHIVVRFEGTNYSAAKIVWCLAYRRWPDFPIVHSDGNNANNRPSNLMRKPSKAGQVQPTYGILQTDDGVAVVKPNGEVKWMRGNA